MHVSPQEIAKEAKLFRQSGHPKQSARLLSVARIHYPSEPCLEKEHQRLAAEEQRPLKGPRRIITAAVDLLGFPVFAVWLGLGCYILVNLFFVPSG
jgi:hypothetical protein